MLSLTRKAGYGLIAMAHLAHYPGQRVSAREIALKNRLPVSLVMNVMKRLCAAGYVKSVRGAGGGYLLVGRPEDILIGPLLDEIDGPVRDSRCKREDRGLPPRPHDKPCPNTDTCPHANPVHLIHRKIRDFLQKVSLADIMSGQGNTSHQASDGTGENECSKGSDDGA